MNEEQFYELMKKQKQEIAKGKPEYRQDLYNLVNETIKRYEQNKQSFRKIQRNRRFLQSRLEDIHLKFTLLKFDLDCRIKELRG